MSSMVSKEDIITHQIGMLRQLIGAQIRKLMRYSWWPLAESLQEVGLPESQSELLFQVTEGPLYLTTEDGLTLGFGSQPSLASVTVWENKTAGQNNGESDVEIDDELFPIQADDPVYSNKAVGALLRSRITELLLLKRDYHRSLYLSLPCEVGLVLRCQSKEVILSHGLYNDSDSFCVIERRLISPSVLPYLTESRLL